MLELQIDPYGWMMAVPLAVLMVWVYFLPSNHALKRGWQHVRQAELEVLSFVTGWDHQPRPRPAWFGPLLFWATVSVLTGISAASVCVYLQR